MNKALTKPPCYGTALPTKISDPQLSALLYRYQRSSYLKQKFAFSRQRELRYLNLLPIMNLSLLKNSISHFYWYKHLN